MNLENTDAIASVLVGFSTISFIVLFGIATFIPTIYESTILNKQSAKLIRHYPYRLISRLGGTGSIAVLIITSITFAVIGLLSLFYFLINEAILIKLAIGLSSLIIIILITYIVLISIYAKNYNEKEIDTIIGYATSQHNKKPDNKTKTKNGSKR